MGAIAYTIISAGGVGIIFATIFNFTAAAVGWGFLIPLLSILAGSWFDFAGFAIISAIGVTILVFKNAGTKQWQNFRR